MTNLNNNEQEISRSAAPRICVEIECEVILHADQRPKQNHKDQNLPAFFTKNEYLFGRDFGPMLSQEKYSISDYAVSKKLMSSSSTCTDMCIEKMMEQLNSGASLKIFRNISCIHFIGLIASGKQAWQEEEETRKNTSIVLIRQE